MERTTKVKTFSVAVALAGVLAAGSCQQDDADEADNKTTAGALTQASANASPAYLVMMREQANLAPARGMTDWAARGRFVFDELTRTARSSSTAALYGRMRTRGYRMKQFWIVNGFRIESDAATAQELRNDPAVAAVVPETVFSIPPVAPGQQQATVNGVEWGLDNINVPQVWATFGARGAGITVANVDTGVEYTHAALVRQYRGNNGTTFNHNYNWFDPTGICPPGTPCDNNDHGTHTMGTMVGDDGSGNLIGVAAEAKWIAAKGCENKFCTDGSLLSSGEWILAPTDLTGANPRPDLRPHIVNNSWGGGSNNPFFRATVQAWVASGIFPVFSNGNSGPDCGTVGAPAEYPESYAAGAYDINNVLADFSSRGLSVFGDIKPNAAAPGVDVRSSVRGNVYASFSGTSMAAPHISGVVALMWSAAPGLVGDIEATRTLLDATARDVEDLTCGGTATNNNLWGEGRVDAFAAVNQSPRCTPGPLQICSIATFPKRFEGGIGIAATGTVVLNGVAPAGGAV